MLKGGSEMKVKLKVMMHNIVRPIGCLFLLLVLLCLSSRSFALVYHLYAVLVGQTRLLCTACTEMYTSLLDLTCSFFVQTCSLVTSFWWCLALLLMCCIVIGCILLMHVLCSCRPAVLWHHADDAFLYYWLRHAFSDSDMHSLFQTCILYMC